MNAKPSLHILRTTKGYKMALTMFDPVKGEAWFDFCPPFNREKHPADWREYENWRDNLLNELLE